MVSNGRERVRPVYGKLVNDRFGYRPTPYVKKETLSFSYRQGLTEKQAFLDKIKLDQMERKWHDLRVEKSRENWSGFGNKSLPIESYRKNIMRTIEGNRISLLAGETGCGKSTQLAQYALEMGYDRIVYLQPRRVTTDNISERLEEELSEQFKARNMDMDEHLVGMAHSERATIHEDSIIQVMTSAVFKKRVAELREQWKSEKVLIVADEVHEGNIETEFAVAAAAELMADPEHKSWNMVLMSATLDEEKIQQAYQPINGREIPSVTIEGRPFDIEEHELPDMDVVEIFEQECLDSGNKTLIFTDGKRSVEAIKKELMYKFGSKVRVLALSSKIDEQTRHEIFHTEDPPGVHTVIVSTSAGQSGLTIKGVDRVISDGWTKSPELDDENASGLPRRLCTRAELTQQMGRGGRDVPNAKFFLGRYRNDPSLVGKADLGFASKDSELRGDHIPPDIYHTVILRNVLSASAMDRDFYSLNEYLINKVTVETISEAYAVLLLIGAVDEDNKVTDIGREMDKFPLRPELARALVEAIRNGTEAQKYQVAIISACIEAGGLLGADLDGKMSMISSGTQDDFIAELDMFMYKYSQLINDNTKEDSSLESLSVEDGHESVADSLDKSVHRPKGIDNINARRALKQYFKICYRAGLDPKNWSAVSNEFTDEQRQELHAFFLSGMPHLIYQEVRREKHRGRKKHDSHGNIIKQPPHVWYRNILAPPKEVDYEFDRKLGKVSLLGVSLPKYGYVAGYPRWYIDKEGDTINVIESGFATRSAAIKRTLGSSALQIKESVEVGPDGRLYLRRGALLGRFMVGDTVSSDKASTDDKVRMLAEQSLERPYPAQRELRALKSELEEINRRIPYNQKTSYFDKKPLTSYDIEQIVLEASRNAGSLGEVDANIRRLSIDLNDYITDDKYLAVLEAMPDEMTVGGEILRVHYQEDKKATPMIYEFPLSLASFLPDTLRIPDGREVKFRYKYNDEEERILSTADVKSIADA